jgi:hypothetical protein
MILNNRKTWEEDKGLWLRKDRYPRVNRRWQPFINGCNMKGARWPKQYWRNHVRRQLQHRIEALWIRTHNPDWMMRDEATEDLERQIEAIGSPFSTPQRSEG